LAHTVFRLPPRIEIIATGDELLDGSIADTNTQRLAQFLAPCGLRPHRTTVVPDDKQVLSQVMAEAALRSDIILVSGGLGPTTDDLTLEVAAQTFGARLVPSAAAKKNILQRLKKMKRKVVNPSQWKQALIPEGAHVLLNEEGTAPGIKWNVGDRTFFFLPGVPRELIHLWQKHLAAYFLKIAPPQGLYLVSLRFMGVPESELNEWMKSQKIPAGVQVGYRTHLPENHIKFHVRAASALAASRQVASLIKKAQRDYGKKCLGTSGQSLEAQVIEVFSKKKATLAVAESCTGGQIAAALTSVSGASKVFLQGWITYSNESKVRELGVNPKTLEKFGAVSEQTAREMAAGALVHSGSSVAVAVTGIAGPSGGTPQKPVGTIWLAVALQKKKRIEVKTQLLQLPYNRELNQKFTVAKALAWSLEQLSR
jgi:nicotinamide-nucleotide amidase